MAAGGGFWVAAGGGGYFRYFAQFVEQLPIRRINFGDAKEVSIHDDVTSLAGRVMSLHQRLSASRLAQDRQRLERQILATTQRIDFVVYGLYDLTASEVKLVEAGAGKAGDRS